MGIAQRHFARRSLSLLAFPLRSLVNFEEIHTSTCNNKENAWRSYCQRTTPCRGNSRESTCFTIFCSSIRKARTMRARTHLAQREPPYARDTFFLFFARRAYRVGFSTGIPWRAEWQSPHFGALHFLDTL